MPRFLLFPFVFLFPIFLSVLVDVVTGPLLAAASQSADTKLQVLRSADAEAWRVFAEGGHDPLALRLAAAFWSVRLLLVAVPVVAILLPPRRASVADAGTLLSVLVAGFCVGRLLTGFFAVPWPAVFLWLAVGTAAALALLVRRRRA